jgi:hypothetical protein
MLGRTYTLHITYFYVCVEAYSRRLSCDHPLSLRVAEATPVDLIQQAGSDKELSAGVICDLKGRDNGTL